MLIGPSRGLRTPRGAVHIQIFWVYLVSFPVIWVNSVTRVNPQLGPLDYIGIILWAVGFLAQLSSDFQKLLFRRDSSNKLKICKVRVGTDG